MSINWTDEQKKVINSRGGNLLVSAAAGSGKTAVLVERILEMILGVDSDGNKIAEGIDVDEILVVTFTKAAAAQMKEKIAKALENAAAQYPDDDHIVKQLSLISRADISTIDSFCRSVVKDYFNEVGIDVGFDILDDAELALMKRDVFDEVLEEFYQEGTEEFFALVDTFARKESDEKLRDLVQLVCKLARSYPKPIEWLEEARDSLAMTSKEELMNAKWYVSLMDELNKLASEALWIINECKEICNTENGPIAYLPNIEEDEVALKVLAESRDIDEVYAALEACGKKFAGLKRNKACDAELQRLCKAGIDVYRAPLKPIFAWILPSEQILAENELMAKPLRALIDLAEAYIYRLSDTKRKKNLYEIPDISEFAYDIICDGRDEEGLAIPSAVGKQIGSRYKEIFIDEYQDSNFLQEDTLGAVARGRGESNMFMVGDIKQSIYRFRMARPELFLGKFNTYTSSDTPADTDKGRKILLSTNFRSQQKVVDAVNSIFRPLMGANLGGIIYDSDAELKCGRKIDCTRTEETAMTDNPEIHILHMDEDCGEDVNTVEVEARFIAKKIHAMVKGDDPYYIPSDAGYRRVEYGDIVILMRSVKNTAAIYEDIFAEMNIPLYTLSESGYFDAMEVRTLLSMLAVVDNSYQDYPLAAVLRSPLANCSEEHMAKAVAYYDRDHAGEDLAITKGALLYDKVVYYTENYDCEGYTKFLAMLNYLKANKQYMSISDMLRYILKETSYYWYVGSLPAGTRRQANIDMLISKADTYESTSYKGLFNFLRYMDRLKVNDVDFAQGSMSTDSKEMVSLTTMHKSKGLEYPVVFVSNLCTRLTPKESPDPVVVDADAYISGFAYNMEYRVKKKTVARYATRLFMERSSLAEENRVLYVALTRAKDKLFMTGAIKSKKDQGLDAYDYSGIFLRDGAITYTQKVEGKSFMDWIMMSIYAEKQLYRTPNIEINQWRAADLDIWTPPEEDDTALTNEEATAIYADLESRVKFTYPHTLNKAIKAKLSVSEIKRMSQAGEGNSIMDIFTYIDADRPIPMLSSRQEEASVTGAELGSAIHKIVEVLDWDRITPSDVEQQVEDLFANGVLQERFRGKLNLNKFQKLFASDLGKRMLAAHKRGELYREEQFYVAMKPEDVSDAYKGVDDDIIVQGVVDAYFVEDGKLHIVDYKTDKVRSMKDLVDRYHAQIEVYSSAIEKVTGMPVAERIIYSFVLDKFINL